MNLKKIIKIIFFILSVAFFTLVYTTSKADFVIQAEDYKSGESVGYYDRDIVNRGGAYRTSEGVDIYNIAGIKDGVLPVTAEDGTFRVSYIESGEWISYQKSIPVGDAGHESGIYKVYLRVASNLDGNGVRLLNSLNGGPVVNISTTNFNRTGTFTDAAGAVWKDIEIGTVVLKEGDNLIKLDFTTGAASDWEYSINYLKFKRQETEKVEYDDNGIVGDAKNYTFFRKSDYESMNKTGNVLGDIEDVVVNSENEVRGFVWDLDNYTNKYILDVEIYDSTGGTLIGKMENFAIASEINPAIKYTDWDIRMMIAMGVFPTFGDYHGFTMGKKAILEHAQIRFNIQKQTTVKIKIVPKNPTGAETIFNNKMIDGVITLPATYDKSVTVNQTDMSQFPQIGVYFTTVGINSISKLGGSAENGEVNELSDLSYGTGDVVSIEDKGEVVGMPIDVRIIYENSTSMNNAALTKINNTINTLKAKGFIIDRKDIQVAIDAANTGIWSNIYNAMDEVINQNTGNSFDYLRKSYKWIVVAAAANNYNPVSSQVDKLTVDMLKEDRNVMLTVVDQDTGNNVVNDIDAAFKNSTYEEEGGKYYSGHLGVGKTGEFMLDAANMYIVGKTKQWKLIYNSPLSERDGTERRRNFVVVDELGGSHGPAVSYYRAPRYGAAEQTIVLSKTSIPFDMKIKPINFIDEITATDYEAVKYVSASGVSYIEDYNYSEERHFRPEYNTTTGAFTTKFTYTGEQDKAYVMINKSVSTNGSGILKTEINNDAGAVSGKINYQDKYIVGTADIVNGDRETSEWSWTGYTNSYFNKSEVMIRVVKGAYAADERYNVFAKDVIKVPAYAYKDNIGNAGLVSDFISNDSRKYIDFRFTEINAMPMIEPPPINIGGLTVTYNYQNFKIKGLPATNSYTIQLYTIRYGNNGSEYSIITYNGSTVLPVVNISLDAEIKSPVTNGTFMYSQLNLDNVVVKGIVRSIVKKSNSSIPTYEKPIATVSIYKRGEATPIAGAKDLPCTLGATAVSDGYYEFTLEVAEKILRDTGVEKFDIKLTAVNDKKDVQVRADNIGIDAGAPKVLTVKMVNLTSIKELSAMQLSDGGGNVFNETEALNLSTLEYILNTAENYKWIPMGNIVFDSRIDKATKDGRFVKGPVERLYGDEVEITAEFIEENIDVSKLNLESDKNVIKAKFDGLNTMGYIPPVSVTYAPHTVGTGIKITAVWRFNVENIYNTVAVMKIMAIDALGNSSESKLGDIEIAVVDNLRPKNPSITISRIERTDPITITNIDYQLKCSATNITDENGIRAFKILYNYNPNQSDWGADGRTGTGNHDKDKYDGDGEPGINEVANRYFYVKAGDGINLLDEIIEGIGIKTLVGSFDDGLYSRYRVFAVDKAGNETVTEGIEKILVVDTVAPRIRDAVLKKIGDRDGFVPKDINGNPISYSDNLIKGGDTARIEYNVTEFNISENIVKDTVTYYDAGYLWMINNAAETPDVVLGNIENTLTYENMTNRKGYRVAVKIGEKNASFTNAAFEKPNILVMNSSSNGAMPTTIIAKDLAGNIGTITISPELDNTAPETVEVYAYAYELYAQPSYEQYVNLEDKLYGGSPENGAVHITRGGDSGNDFFIKLKGVTSDMAYYTTYWGSAESEKKDMVVPNTDYIQFSTTHTTTDFIPIYGPNIVTVKVRDLAGNQSLISNEAKIVIDTMVGDKTTVISQQGGTARNVSGGYEFSIKLILPEYAGIKEIIPKKIANGSILKEITGVSAVEITDSLLPSSMGINQVIDKKLFISKSKIPDVVRGSRATVTFRITDNLDNEKYFNISYLIPKEGLEIKAQQVDSQKETRTKVKVVGENEFELQKTEEGGKAK